MSTMPPSAYLDNNATTAVAEQVIDAMLPWFRQQPGNPSSLHNHGEAAFGAIATARSQVAKLLGSARPGEILFTSSATESTNTAAHAAFAPQLPKPRSTAICSSVEHAATLQALDAWAPHLVQLPVDRSGGIDLNAALQAIDKAGPDCGLVSLLVVNNETGRIQEPATIRAIAEATHAVGGLVHLDLVQAAGKIPIDVAEYDADMASLSAHKLHGPKGVGALWVKRGALEPFPAMIHGGPQENERRAGTENVPGIVGFGQAAALAGQAAADAPVIAAIAARRDRLEAAFIAELSPLVIAAQEAPRVASTSYVEFHGIDGEAALMMLSQYDIQVSTGSACGARAHGPSHVLLAMGRDEAQASSSLRFSLSRETTDAEIDHAIATVPGVIQTLRTLAGIPG